MQIEARLKRGASGLYNARKLLEWHPVQVGLKVEDINIEDFSIRINKDRQYHKLNTPGFKEEYNKAMAWMMLNVN